MSAEDGAEHNAIHELNSHAPLTKLRRNLALLECEMSLFGHEINFTHLGLTAVPDTLFNLTFRGDLDLSRTLLTSLPDNISTFNIRGSLRLQMNI